ncbi:MAG: hypothetical protein PHC86_03335 [Eubacteriales bacterium]|nr:hypothetical protein [Eubacteriales bacterium]
MNLLLTLESMKFYKIKHERFIQVAFVLLYLINLAPFLLPIGDPDFSVYMTAFEKLLTDPAGPIPMPSVGNLIMMGMVIVASAINLLVTIAYAALMVGEHAQMSGKLILKAFLKGLPQLLLLTVLMIVPLLLSSLLLMIPVLYFVSNFYLLPLLLLSDGNKLTDAMQNSIKMTKGFKIMILLQMFFLSIFLSLPESLILSFLPVSFITSVLIPQFFIVLQTFSQGRLMGIYYLFLVKKVPVMIPSKPQK